MWWLRAPSRRRLYSITAEFYYRRVALWHGPLVGLSRRGKEAVALQKVVGEDRARAFSIPLGHALHGLTRLSTRAT
jgi:hypothetical protein